MSTKIKNGTCNNSLTSLHSALTNRNFCFKTNLSFFLNPRKIKECSLQLLLQILIAHFKKIWRINTNRWKNHMGDFMLLNRIPFQVKMHLCLISITFIFWAVLIPQILWICFAKLGRIAFQICSINLKLTKMPLNIK